jgi:hypothetical protein
MCAGNVLNLQVLGKHRPCTVFVFRRVRKVSKINDYLRRDCLSALMEQLAPTGRIFMKFDFRIFFGKFSRKRKYE